jgi:hypothetical protein
VPIYKKGDKTDCRNCRGISLVPTTYKILSNILVSQVTPHADKIINVDFYVTDQFLIRYSAFVRYKKMGV